MQTEYDIIQRFVFDKTAVRGEIVRLKSSYQTILNQQPYPAPVAAWLGEALAGASLLSATIKFEGMLILQVQTAGPLKVLVAHSTNDGHIRGLAKWDQEQILPDEFAQAAPAGNLAITIQPKQGQRYQGVVSLDNTNLATAIESYFHQSEQLATFLFLAADGNTAAGLLLQNMPVKSDTAYNYFWEHVIKLAATLTANELLSLPNKTILHRLYHEEDIMLFEGGPISFRCTCSTAKSEQMLLTMSYDEVNELLQEYPNIIVTCEFCNHPYTFDAVDVARIFKGAHQQNSAPSQ